jgi:hypothetical protein
LGSAGSGARRFAERLAGALAAAPGRRSFGPLLLVASVAAQAALYELGPRPIPTIASAYAVSTAIGLCKGRGLTVQPDEASAVRQGAERFEDLLPLYRSQAPRSPAHEPLPGVSLLFAAVAALSGSLRLGTIVYLQILLHGLGAWWLAAELRQRSGLAAALAGIGWALFLPEFRSTLTPGYDSLPTLVYLGAVLPLLRFGRGGGPAWLIGAGLACGAGLWVRDYLFVLPLLLLPVLATLRQPGLSGLLAFGLPVALLGAGLALARAPASGTTHRLIRGGVWHTFWAGVGQFDNDLGLVAEDESVRDFASRLAPSEEFRVPNYQYLPSYDAALGLAGRAYVAERWPALLRNALYRLGWLVFPAFGPSKQLASGPLRLLLLAVGIPLSLLALAGFLRLWRADRFAALVLAAPVLSLLPLAPYYFIAKVPTAAFFSQLAFAGWALAGLARKPG